MMLHLAAAGSVGMVIGNGRAVSALDGRSVKTQRLST